METQEFTMQDLLDAAEKLRTEPIPKTRYMSIDEVVDMYGDHLTDEDIIKIKENYGK